MHNERTYRNNELSIFKKYQRQITAFANSTTGRKFLNLPNEHIELLLPFGYITKQDRFYKAVLYSKSIYAKKLYLPLQALFRRDYLDIGFNHDNRVLNLIDPEFPLRYRFYTKTFTPDADPETTTIDGYALRQGTNEVFTDLRNGAGTLANSTDPSASAPYIAASTVTDRFGQMTRNIYLFDTSFLGITDFILSATLSIVGTSKDNQLGGSPEIDCVTSSPASNTALIAADYGSLGSTVFASIPYASWDGAGTNVFNLSQAGIDNIIPEGISKFGTRIDWDTDDAFGGAWSISGAVRFDGAFSDSVGDEPTLTVIYESHGDTYMGQL